MGERRSGDAETTMASLSTQHIKGECTKNKKQTVNNDNNNKYRLMLQVSYGGKKKKISCVLY